MWRLGIVSARPPESSGLVGVCFEEAIEVLENLVCQDIDRVLPRAKLRRRDLAELCLTSLVAFCIPRTLRINNGKHSPSEDK